MSEMERVEKELLARWPESRIEWKLERMRALMDALGNPHLAYPVLHIAGTNGKTSTARMAEALLRAMNLRTGVYTSPHLESMTERVVIDGEPLTPQGFAEAYDDIAPFLALVDDRFDTKLSFFEAITGLAFAAFADAPVDAAVVEVGMGGRLDATNVVQPAVTVVTPVSLDHMQYLGDTVEEIAGEKAGIIKPGVPVILSLQQASADVVLRAAADAAGAPLLAAGVDFDVEERRVAVGGQVLALRGIRGRYDDVFLPLHGEHQAFNAVCALAAVESFAGGGKALDADLVRHAFAAVRSPGRLEVVRTNPTVLVDAAHNPAGAQVTARALAEEFRFTRLVGVVAVLGDKDAAGILAALEPVLHSVVVSANSSHRAMPVDDLAAAAVQVFGAERVDVVERLDAAIDAALDIATEEAPDGAGAGVVVTGSVVTAGEARHLLTPPPEDAP